MVETMTDKQPRRLNYSAAAVAGLFGFGLGYLYVGRGRLAFLPFAVLLLLLAIFGWTRAIIVPEGLYSSFVLVFLVWVVSIIHPLVIIRQHNEIPAKPYNRGWIYLLWIVALSLVMQQVIAHRGLIFGYDLFRIPSGSMAPTVEKGDSIIANTWHFDDVAPQFGDLVVYDLPRNTNIKYLKRIVGLPGDTIEIRDDVLIRNGTAVKENYVYLSDRSSPLLSTFELQVVPDDHYFVLGDNRHNSRDSRFIGPIPKDLIRGHVKYRWFAYDQGIRWDRFPENLTIAGNSTE